MALQHADGLFGVLGFLGCEACLLAEFDGVHTDKCIILHDQNGVAVEIERLSHEA